MRRLLVVVALAVGGCASAHGGSAAIYGSGAGAATPVSAPWTQGFADRVRAWLNTQPPYHRSHHHAGILLVSSMTAAGDWHGLVVEPDGTLQPLNAASHEDSYAIAALVSPGDEVQIDYSNADILSVIDGSQDIAVMVRGAVAP